MNKNSTYILLALVLLFPYVIFSQMVNTGNLTISPGTKMSTVGALDNKPSGDLVNDGELFVYSHYNNDGLVTFTTGATTGMTRMRGVAGFQNITGLMPMEWYNGEFNNGSVQPAFHLSNEVSVAGQANFQSGIVDNRNYSGLLVFENKATHINADDNSHVYGSVQKNGKDAFRYPIGDAGKYRFAAITAPSGIADAFAGKYFLKNSNSLYPHSKKSSLSVITLIDDAEYWTIDKIAGTSNVYLTLSWDAATTPSAIYTGPSEEIHIVRWDATQNAWVDEGGVADAAAKEVTMVVDPLKSYGVFTLARVKVDKSLVIYNAVSPNGDGLNDYFRIDGIGAYTNNTVTIYNRWGVKVYETTAYNTNGNVFKGISEGRVTVNVNEKLPVGTYFYIIDFQNSNDGASNKKAGYLYINEK
jgi:gliding motility-associated-like protein